MVVVKLSHGLGNQLFQYASARSLADYHNVPLALDLSWFDNNDSRDCSLDKFNVRAINAGKNLNRFLRSANINRLGRLFRKASFLHHDEVVDPIWSTLDFFQLGKSVTLSGYWVHNYYFEENFDPLRRDLTLNANYETEEFNRLKDEVSGSESVAVHVRRGDYLTKKENDFFGTLKSDYYQRAFDLVFSHVEKPIFWVFTDDPEWVDKEMNLPENSQIASTKVGCIDYLEVIIMSYCKHNIIANSTFGWWGAALNSNEQATIIQPEIWYKNKKAQAAYEKRKILKVPRSVYL